jgi:hypothetical protein
MCKREAHRRRDAVPVASRSTGRLPSTLLSDDSDEHEVDLVGALQHNRYAACVSEELSSDQRAQRRGAKFKRTLTRKRMRPGHTRETTTGDLATTTGLCELELLRFLHVVFALHSTHCAHKVHVVLLH